MIIVSDTTTVANLFAIGQFHLLPALFETVILPESVYQELMAQNGFPNETDEQVRVGVLRVRAATNTAEVHRLLFWTKRARRSSSYFVNFNFTKNAPGRSTPFRSSFWLGISVPMILPTAHPLT